MEGESFPRVDRKNTLDLLQGLSLIERPPLFADTDRYLFLQALFSAKESLILFSQNKNPLDGTELPLCDPIEQIRPYVSPKWIFQHPAKSYDSCYFAPSFFVQTYRKLDEHLHRCLEGKKTEKQDPFLPPMEEEEKKEQIDLLDLKRLVRSPLRHFLYHKRIRLYEEKELPMEEPFALSPLEEAVLRSRWIKKPEKGAQKGTHFPLSLFGKLATMRLREEVDNLQKRLHPFSLQKHSLEAPFSFALPKGTHVTLTGMVEDCFEKGVVSFAKQKSFAQVLLSWPSLLLAQQIDCEKKDLFFVRHGVQKTLVRDGESAHLQSLIRYYQLAKRQFVPFFPDWVEPILQKNTKKLRLLVEKEPFDSLSQWYFQTWNCFSIEALIEMWHPLAREYFGEVYDAWL